MASPMKTLRVTCQKCGGSNKAYIYPAGPASWMIDLNRDHAESDKVVIISGRYRKDMKFGWECGVCGNDSRLSRQELPEIRELVVGGDQGTIDRIVTSLQDEDEEKFLVTDA